MNKLVCIQVDKWGLLGIKHVLNRSDHSVWSPYPLVSPPVCCYIVFCMDHTVFNPSGGVISCCSHHTSWNALDFSGLSNTDRNIESLPNERIKCSFGILRSAWHQGFELKAYVELTRLSWRTEVRLVLGWE